MEVFAAEHRVIREQLGAAGKTQAQIDAALREAYRRAYVRNGVDERYWEPYGSLGYELQMRPCGTPMQYTMTRLLVVNAQLPADVPLPQALPNWTAPLVYLSWCE
eukprot:COSAG03_NODE_683_length_6318_cov_4.005467_9_plen_105_part_00